MPARLDYNVVAPQGLRAMRALDQYVRKSGLEPGLIEFVKLRASLMNGCAYCVDLHAREARAQGETERRLFAVPVWPETPFFTPRERAALAWTEAVTQIGGVRSTRVLGVHSQGRDQGVSGTCGPAKEKALISDAHHLRGVRR